ncbi:MAG: hypothetical protein H8E44_35275 [Planctomycetes bacterium]|nr:hypothetical protein [Planctomycetota bacterium]MBL7040581.1 hypothetical protein [Pirellulaceae bacterium]
MKKRFRWKRLVQIRLATLMILVTLCAVVLGFRQAFIVPYLRQDAAVERIKKVNGALTFSPAQPAWLAPIVGRKIYHRVTWVHLENRDVDDRLMPALRDMPHVTNLYLAGNPITDEGLRHIAGLEHVQRLSLWRTRITDDGLRHLAKMKGLTALDLHTTAVTDEGLARLTGLTELRELHLPPRISDEGLAHLRGLSNLCVLNASEARWITPSGLRHLAGCPIQSIQAGFLGMLRGDELKHLSALRHVNTCVPMLTATDCSDVHLKHLAGMPELSELSVSGADLTDASLVHIEPLRNLTKLHVTGRISTAGLDSLRKLPRLKQLHLTTELIGEEDLPALRGGWNGQVITLASPWFDPGPNAEPDRTSRYTIFGKRRQQRLVKLDHGGQLYISSPPYMPPAHIDQPGQVVSVSVSLSVAARSEDLNRLTRWPELRTLTISSSASIPLSLDAVVACRKLETLALLDCEFDPTELGKLRSLDRLSDLTLRLKRHDESLLPQLGQLKRLQVVKLILPRIPQDYVNLLHTTLPGVAVNVVLRSDVRAEPSRVRVKSLWSADLGELASLEPFEKLEMYGVGRLRDLSGLESFGGLVELKLPGANVGPPEQWKHVGRLENLTLLTLDRSNITDDALRHIGRLARLRQLDLNDTLVSDRGIVHLDGLRELQHLQLSCRWRDAGPWITDDALRTIGRLTNLVNLQLTGLDVTDEGLKHLAPLERLERLNLSRTHITNDGLTELAALKSLQYLDLFGCQIDDDGLAVLAEHPSLREVNARRTQITAKAARLKGRRDFRVHATR